MPRRFIIVTRTPEPPVKPEYTDLEEATAALLARRRGHPDPASLVLVQIDQDLKTIQTVDLTVTESA